MTKQKVPKINAASEPDASKISSTAL